MASPICALGLGDKVHLPGTVMIYQSPESTIALTRLSLM